MNKEKNDFSQTYKEEVEMKKRLLAASLSAMLLLATPVTALAAGTTDENEEEIIAQLQAANVPAEYVSQAKNYFMQDDVTITKEEASAVIANINYASAIAKGAGITSVDDLKKADSAVVDQIMSKASAAAAAADLSVSFDTKAGKAEVRDANGKIVATADVKTKKTGADSMSTVAVVGLLGAAVAGLTVASKKKTEGEA